MIQGISPRLVLRRKIGRTIFSSIPDSIVDEVFLHRASQWGIRVSQRIVSGRQVPPPNGCSPKRNTLRLSGVSERPAGAPSRAHSGTQSSRSATALHHASMTSCLRCVDTSLPFEGQYLISSNGPSKDSMTILLRVGATEPRRHCLHPNPSRSTPPHVRNTLEDSESKPIRISPSRCPGSES
jgi:hypothetical protein